MSTELTTGPRTLFVPPGGVTGQVLAKASNDDYDDHWVDPVVTPGEGGVVSVNGDPGPAVVIDKSGVGLGNVDNTSDANKPLSNATTLALADKAPINSPTFTGTVSGVSKTMVGLGNVDNTADTAKPVSTAQQTALNLKANLDGPTFTGTVGGITKAMVGLGNVDNTSDVNKPISILTQVELNKKGNVLGFGDEAAMLAVASAKVGDYFLRTDTTPEEIWFVRNASDLTEINNWTGPRVITGESAGALPEFNAVRSFNGGERVRITSTGVVRAFQTGLYRLICLTAGTIKLWDNGVASGDAIVDTTAMTAGQVIELGQISTNGVFATVTSGTYNLVDTGA